METSFSGGDIFLPPHFLWLAREEGFVCLISTSIPLTMGFANLGRPGFQLHPAFKDVTPFFS
jgi:hypothetical protein